MKPKMTRHRAFTLVEILVVVGIITLLAGLSFPVFNRVREGGRKTVCTNNLRQLGLAFQQYLQDSSGRYPGTGAGIDLNGVKSWENDGNWVKGDGFLAAIDDTTNAPVKTGEYIPGRKANVEGGALYPFVKTPTVYYCPSVPNGSDKGLSYAMNCALTGANSLRIQNIAAQLVLLVDEDKANDGYFLAVDDVPAGSTYNGQPSNSTDALTQAHNGGGNILFADGHVEFFPAQELVIDGTPQGKANKWRETGTPRFHDQALGKFGSSIGAGQTVDYCNATKR